MVVETPVVCRAPDISVVENNEKGKHAHPPQYTHISPYHITLTHIPHIHTYTLNIHKPPHAPTPTHLPRIPTYIFKHAFTFIHSFTPPHTNIPSTRTSSNWSAHTSLHTLISRHIPTPTLILWTHQVASPCWHGLNYVGPLICRFSTWQFCALRYHQLTEHKALSLYEF